VQDNSIQKEAYTVTVWMFVDWISRYPGVMTGSREETPLAWTSGQWREAIHLEQALRLYEPDMVAPLLAVKVEIPPEIRRYVRDNESDLVRADDGILRRFPDSVLEILLVADNAKVDPVHAMRDAVEIVRSGREC
jgi:hypothetical protein